MPLSSPEPLADEDHLLDSFDSGEPVLDDWLRRRARANQASGSEWHAVHSEQVGRTARSDRLARAFAFALLVLLLALAFLLVLLALFAFCGWMYFSRRSATGLPDGLVVYDDAGRQHLQRPLVSHRLRLAGRPDYLIETADGLVPVELKSGACPRSGPHAAHVAQLMTYCVLVEDALARPVPYGVLQYADARRQIPFTGGRKERFFNWRTKFDASAALPMYTDNINTLGVVGSAATGLCAKSP